MTALTLLLISPNQFPGLLADVPVSDILIDHNLRASPDVWERQSMYGYERAEPWKTAGTEEAGAD